MGAHMPTWRFTLTHDEERPTRRTRRVLVEQFEGTAEEAIAHARTLPCGFPDWVAIRCIGELPPLQESERLVFVIRERHTRDGWNSEDNRRHHGAWHRTIENAVDYTAFRGRDYLCEFRVFSRDGSLIELILADLRRR